MLGLVPLADARRSRQRAISRTRLEGRLLELEGATLHLEVLASGPRQGLVSGSRQLTWSASAISTSTASELESVVDKPGAGHRLDHRSQGVGVRNPDSITRPPAVLVDQPTEEVPPADIARVDRDRLSGHCDWRGEAEGAVRPEGFNNRRWRRLPAQRQTTRILGPSSGRTRSCTHLTLTVASMVRSVGSGIDRLVLCGTWRCAARLSP